MTDSQSSSQFVPLVKRSQCTSMNVLYFDSTAPAKNLLDCATKRIYLAGDLSTIVNEVDNLPTKAIKKMVLASELLRSDSLALIETVQNRYRSK
ncbi:hypothetical protein DM558_11175 [Entomomonas moraniae]|uniref:DUF3077 domain-containing protein n=1 Tax=Entomomonas moraniae TaxID=2213226 RepID=A0A3S9XFU8_9GAMM|nr:hypothetical protein [Entomomonas moraniae]AZS51299.1 hypothetical protein DM558_11175 [Entomomonas moraniae]